jgi:hypothetical protein
MKILRQLVPVLIGAINESRRKTQPQIPVVSETGNHIQGALSRIYSNPALIHLARHINFALRSASLSAESQTRRHRSCASASARAIWLRSPAPSEHKAAANDALLQRQGRPGAEQVSLLYRSNLVEPFQKAVGGFIGP